MEFWQNIYSEFNPIAFHLGSISVHWYGIMYAFALLSAIYVAKWFIKYDKINIKEEIFDSYIWWAEIGVILGARLGYVLFYDTHTMYYLSHPWQIFNPYIDGVYAGISGMSYHGAFIGFLIATLLFCKKKKVSFWFMTDIAVLGISFGYIFGRLGNFFNQGLIGRVTDVPWGIYVNGILRHPSQIYEAILEGLIVFLILIYFRNRKKFDGQLAIIYALCYSIARIIAEFYRQPDVQLGFLYGGWVTMGMIQSFCVLLITVIVLTIMKKRVG
jgi:phosphatidylglycerol:prolipoprotein diacylglycerol transferase